MDVGRLDGQSGQKVNFYHLPHNTCYYYQKTPKRLRRQHIEVTGTLHWQSATMGIPNKSLCPSCRRPQFPKKQTIDTKRFYQNRITRTRECTQIMGTSAFLPRDSQYMSIPWMKVCRLKTILCQKIRSHQKQTFKIQQTFGFERPALVDAMEFLQASQIPKPGTNSNSLHSHITNSRHARHIDLQLPYTRGISHGQTCDVLSLYTQSHHIRLTRSKIWKMKSNVARNSNSLLKRFLTTATDASAKH